MKLLLFETIPVLRQALAGRIQKHRDITNVQLCSSVEETLQLLAEKCPDLLWLDGTAPGVREQHLIRQIRRTAPHLKILLFGSGESVPEIKKYFLDGILVYLPKTSEVVEIDLALQSLFEGTLFVPPSINFTFTNWLTQKVLKKKQGFDLTSREKEILSLIVEEHTTGEIAKKLYISACTVETHRVNLIQKLGVKNTAGLVRVAFESGLYFRGII